MRLLKALTLLALLSPLVLAQDPAEGPVPPYQLSDMKVVQFSERTGALGAEIKKNSDFFALNELNISLFVTIEVSGKGGSYSPKRSVDIAAYEGTRLILKRVGQLGVFDESTGKYHVPVFLYGPFCQPITIKARLVGQARPSTLQRKIEFHCGE